ncbi:hydroxyproline-rich glycoprotein family protein [Parasponia andersonii]|uniref:Hydroxyproline-rich glycoprotein family protein n=1 Tax=Parasponia andersonii TaxID=3476 RepID=A0A2P5AB12_PARAD|nr:hydroxyproline-rich glycoprotein family protein [Parasponia andersonii]
MAFLKCFAIALLVTTLSFLSIDVGTAARHLLQTAPFNVPALPNFPIPMLPLPPLTTTPSLPQPSIPNLPKVTLPPLPDLSIPRNIPSIPGNSMPMPSLSPPPFTIGSTSTP